MAASMTSWCPQTKPAPKRAGVATRARGSKISVAPSPGPTTTAPVSPSVTTTERASASGDDRTASTTRS